MSKRRQRRKQSLQKATRRESSISRAVNAEQAYQRASALAQQREFHRARTAYKTLALQKMPPRLRALVESDLGALDAVYGDMAAARTQFERALTLDAQCEVARKNLAMLANDRACDSFATDASGSDTASMTPHVRSGPRVAIVSLLFNWPSTGGGTVHTAEIGKFLGLAGYDVRHFYAKYPEWGVGIVTLPLDVPSDAIHFDTSCWNASEIQQQFRKAIDKFAPDYVIITDSWNFKPLFAEALQGYRFFLRLAALECLCPLNNVRLLVNEKGDVTACPRHQLATPDICRSCVGALQQHSGGLHQAERALSGYGTREYNEKLRHAFAEAEGILAVNPLIATMVSPFAKAVHVVPSGFDPERFPWPWPDEGGRQLKGRTTIFFAGMIDEYMKGFRVLHAACAKLWQKRQDFELVATADPPGEFDPMTRFVGWLSQRDLPKQLRAADFLVFPTVAEEALGRTAVEAMGVGRPVIASRIGGLPFTIAEGTTGLLFEPGNIDDLAAKIEMLLDDPELRRRMGDAGRSRFVEQFTWQSIIDKHYRPLLKPITEGPSVIIQRDATEKEPAEAIRPDSLFGEAAEFFGIKEGDVSRMFATYSSIHENRSPSARQLGPSGLTVEHGFLVCLLLSMTRPSSIIVADDGAPSVAGELQNMKTLVGLTSPVIHVNGRTLALVQSSDHTTEIPEPWWEATAGQAEMAGDFRTDVLDRHGSGFLWLRNASQKLVGEALTQATRHFGQWLVAIQDKEQSGQRGEAGPFQNLTRSLGFSGNDKDQTNATHRLRAFHASGSIVLVIPRYVTPASPTPT